MKAVCLTLVLAVVLAGCQGGPAPIVYGQDECAACRMRIADQRFGSALVTRHGKTFKFDAVECLVGFLDRGQVAEADTHSVWVADFTRPGELIDARTAHYLRTDRVRSPMGLNVLAFGSATDRDAARTQYQGTPLTWTQLPEVRRQAVQAKQPAAPPAAPR